MTLLKIAQIGHPILRTRCLPVGDPTDPEVRRLAHDMVETMRDAPGVGLAGPQVYQDARIIVFLVPPGRREEGEAEGPADVTVLVNPSYEPMGEAMTAGLEGCLSIPELRGVVPRHSHIRYRGTTPEGETVEREAGGFHARVVQHEIDHLDGVLFLDRMRDLSLLAAASEVHHLLEDE
ncbi:MAG: peptide deformylase [Azospirillaceae bacterium]